MPAEDHHSAELKEHLLRAIEMPAAEQRAYLQELESSDPGLASQLRELVGAWEDAATMLKRTHVDTPAPTQAHPREKSGDRIGPYVLEEEIGEGGFGVVFRARQEEPVRREIALKILKAGMDSWAFLKRFELERQALALLNHPSITGILDAGTTPAGRPYFAMELVRGEPINTFCDSQNLSVASRLEIFRDVCRAVQHAHQKGVIHRDLKPTNILVAWEHDKPLAKIIDFGVAKAVDEPITDVSVLTAGAQLIGTPQYMSPEQASLDSTKVDTRSDVFSLGVVLYELLCGSTPLAEDSIRGIGIDELLSRIRGARFDRPSQRFSSVTGRDAVEISEHRGVPTWVLQQTLRSDLDWITMKALDADPARRYQSASSLANDIQRYMDNETVAARPPTTWYQCRKFAARNKALVGGVGASMLLLLAGVVGTGVGLIRAIDARRDAEAQTAVAETEAARALQIAEFLESMLRGIEPDVARGRDTTVLRRIFEETERRVDIELASQPELRSQIHELLGVGYMQLGEMEKAEVQLVLAMDMCRQHYGPEHPYTARAENDLALLYVELARHDEALSLLEHASAVAGESLDPMHKDRLTIGMNYATELARAGRTDEAEPLLRDSLARRRELFGEGDEETIAAMLALARLLSDVGKPVEAEEMLAQALALGRQHLGIENTTTYQALNNLAVIYLEGGRVQEAEPALRESIQVAKRIYGDEHPMTLATTNNLAALLDQLGQWDESESLYLSLLDTNRRIQGDDHPDTARVKNNLANLLSTMKRFDEAESLYIDSLDTRRTVLGELHPETLTSLNNLATFYRSIGRLEEARDRLESAVDAFIQVLGEGHPNTLAVKSNLGDVYTKLGRCEEAKAVHAQTQEGFAAVLPPGHYFHMLALERHGAALACLGQFSEAESELIEAYEGTAGLLGDAHERTMRPVHTLIDMYERWNALEPGAGHGESAIHWQSVLDAAEAINATDDS